MIVKCPECQTMYQLPDEKITASQVKVKCKKCQMVFEIRKPSPKSIPLPQAKPEAEEDEDYQATLAAFVPPSEQSDEHSTEIQQSIAQKKLSIPPGLNPGLEILQEGKTPPQKFDIKTPRLVIGRIGADLSLNDPEISRHHCVIEFYEDTIILRDMHSTNGTFLNELRIKNEKLKNNDKIQVGNTFLIFHV